MVGVADTIQQINSYLLNKHYDGLMKSGKIEGSSLILWQNNQQ
jgi:preprotein translocase subunit SecY